MKKKLALLLALAMVIAMLPAVAWGNPAPNGFVTGATVASDSNLTVSVLRTDIAAAIAYAGPGNHVRLVLNTSGANNQNVIGGFYRGGDDPEDTFGAPLPTTPTSINLMGDSAPEVELVDNANPFVFFTVEMSSSQEGGTLTATLQVARVADGLGWQDFRVAAQGPTRVSARNYGVSITGGTVSRHLGFVILGDLHITETILGSLARWARGDSPQAVRLTAPAGWTWIGAGQVAGTQHAQIAFSGRAGSVSATNATFGVGDTYPIPPNQIVFMIPNVTEATTVLEMGRLTISRLALVPLPGTPADAEILIDVELGVFGPTWDDYLTDNSDGTFTGGNIPGSQEWDAYMWTPDDSGLGWIGDSANWNRRGMEIGTTAAAGNIGAPVNLDDLPTHISGTVTPARSAFNNDNPYARNVSFRITENVPGYLFSRPIETLEVRVVQEGASLVSVEGNLWSGNTAPTTIPSDGTIEIHGAGVNQAAGTMGNFILAPTLMDDDRTWRFITPANDAGGTGARNLDITLNLDVAPGFAHIHGSALEVDVFHQGALLGRVQVATVVDPITLSIDGNPAQLVSQGIIPWVTPVALPTISITETANNRFASGELHFAIVPAVNGILNWGLRSAYTVTEGQTRVNDGAFVPAASGTTTDAFGTGLTGTPVTVTNRTSSVDVVQIAGAMVSSGMMMPGLEFWLVVGGPAVHSAGEYSYRIMVATSGDVGPVPGQLPERMTFTDGQLNVQVTDHLGNPHDVAQVLTTGFTTDGQFRNVLISPRWFAGNIGATQVWDPLAYSFTITLGTTSVTMTMGSPTAVVNGVSYDIADFVNQNSPTGGSSGTIGTVVPQNINGNMMLPARFVGYVFGYTVTPAADLSYAIFTLE